MCSRERWGALPGVRALASTHQRACTRTNGRTDRHRGVMRSWRATRPEGRRPQCQFWYAARSMMRSRNSTPSTATRSSRRSATNTTAHADKWQALRALITDEDALALHLEPCERAGRQLTPDEMLALLGLIPQQESLRHLTNSRALRSVPTRGAEWRTRCVHLQSRTCG